VKFRLLFILVFFALSTLCSAQGVFFSGSATYGTFRMKQFHSIQQEIKATSNFPIRITRDFSPNLLYDFTLGYDRGRNEVGLNFGGESTTGYMIYQERGGKITIDNRFISRYVGLKYTEKFHYTKSGYFYLSGSGNYVKTYGSMETQQLVGSRQQRYGYYFNSNGFNGKLSAGFAFVIENLTIAPEIGYLLNVNDQFVSNQNRNVKMYYNQNELRADWSGIRAGITISLHFNGHNSHQKKLKEPDLQPSDWTF
jgi:hypothetical protein